MSPGHPKTTQYFVALFTSAWIEIWFIQSEEEILKVALFTSAWIEIIWLMISDFLSFGRALHERVD